VGCLVTGATYRHPAVLANMAATVDHITGGRLIVGMGAGWYELEHKMYGIPFYDVPERLRRLNEAVQVMRLLWTEKRANFDGRYFQLKDALCEPKPVQSRLPILIGGGGERVTLKIAARWADAWHSFGPVPLFQHKLDVLRGHCESVGRDYDEIEKAGGGVLVLEETDEKADAKLEAIAAERDMPVERARQLFIYGGPDTVEQKLRAYVDIGVSTFLFNANYDQKMLGFFAKEVMPRFG
jgi:alkanesulfonate monooxygenase SsuD/methylene tetrahydromethanopterin reductase-like flavin-dependent oxidoreductase (luciferase family)